MSKKTRVSSKEDNEPVTKGYLHHCLFDFGEGLSEKIRQGVKKDTTEIVGAVVDELALITSNACTRLEKNIDERFTAVDRRFDRLERRFDSMDRRVTVLENA